MSLQRPLLALAPIPPLAWQIAGERVSAGCRQSPHQPNLPYARTAEESWDARWSRAIATGGACRSPDERCSVRSRGYPCVFRQRPAGLDGREDGRTQCTPEDPVLPVANDPGSIGVPPFRVGRATGAPRTGRAHPTPTRAVHPNVPNPQTRAHRVRRGAWWLLFGGLPLPSGSARMRF